MKIAEAFKSGLELLKVGNVENAEFDCNCLFEHCFGYDKAKRIIHSEDLADKNSFDCFMSLLDRRIKGEPLQYILGKWQFMGFDFSVGEGVLIPRPETELLVEKADEYIKNSGKNLIVYDLCAGSGAIGLSLAKLNPDCEMYLFEKYDKAIEYLKANKDSLAAANAHIVKYDIFDGYSEKYPKPDLILSNPPYIASDEIEHLQPEVKKEPHTALDGGDDGLDFYRCLCKKWFNCINEGGCMILECGDGQSESIRSVFHALSNKIEVFYDFGNIDRTVKINV